MRTVLNNLRWGRGQVANHPGFAVVACLALFLAISANKVLFSMINTLLLGGSSIGAQERLSQVSGHYEAQPPTEKRRLDTNTYDLNTANRPFSALLASAGEETTGRPQQTCTQASKSTQAAPARANDSIRDAYTMGRLARKNHTDSGPENGLLKRNLSSAPDIYASYYPTDRQYQRNNLAAPAAPAAPARRPDTASAPVPVVIIPHLDNLVAEMNQQVKARYDLELTFPGRGEPAPPPARVESARKAHRVSDHKPSGPSSQDGNNPGRTRAGDAFLSACSKVRPAAAQKFVLRTLVKTHSWSQSLGQSLQNLTDQ